MENYNLFLFSDEKFEKIDMYHLYSHTEYFKHNNFYLTNNKDLINNNDIYQFNKEDVKKINNIDFTNDILEYNDFLYELYELLIKFNLKLDDNKLKEFNNDFKEILLFDNGQEDLNDSISIITYKNEDIAYLFDKRCKRDNHDYVYFKNEEVIKNILKDYLNCLDNDSLKIINIELLVEKMNLNSFQILDKIHKFKTNTFIIDKETYDKNVIEVDNIEDSLDFNR